MEILLINSVRFLSISLTRNVLIGEIPPRKQTLMRSPPLERPLDNVNLNIDVHIVI